MASFHETLLAATRALGERLEGKCVEQRELMARLFSQGHEVGLTEKEIVQALLKPLAAGLRPGLKRG